MSDAERVYVVTGANTGIGKATAAGLAALGGRVVLVSRDGVRGEAARAEIAARAPGARVELVQGDLGSLATTRALAAELLARLPRIDALINNAGVWLSARQETPDGYETTFAVNHLAPFLLTNLLRERLAGSAPGRVVNVSSMVYARGRLHLDDLMVERRKYSGLAVYADSKLANVLFTRELARRWAGTGVTAVALHPGVVRTDLTRGLPAVVGWLYKVLGRPFVKSPEQGARTSITCATAPGVEAQSGGFYASSRPQALKGPALDDAAASQLWEVSERLTGLSQGAHAGRSGVSVSSASRVVPPTVT